MERSATARRNGRWGTLRAISPACTFRSITLSTAQLKRAGPLPYVSSARKLPAFLIGRGDADERIPIEQGRL